MSKCSRKFEGLVIILILLSILILTVPSSVKSALRRGEKVPWAFIVRDSQGRPVDLYEILKHKKCVILNFYSRGCVECVKEIPFLKKVYTTYKKYGLEVFIVAVGEKEGGAKRIKEKFKLPFEVIADRYAVMAKDFQIGKFFPQTFVVDRNGVVVEIFVGNIKYKKESFISLIESLLGVRKNEE